MALFWSKKSKAEKIYDNKPIGVAKNSSPKTAKPVNLGKSTPTVSKEVAVAKKNVPAFPIGSFSGAADAIIRPRITEKSGVLSQIGTYTFEVTKGANKSSIARAVKTMYKVTPVKVAISNNPAKNVFVRGRHGVVPGIRKALVTLKKGDKIDFV